MIPGQVDSFWACSKNKDRLEILSRDYFIQVSTTMNVTIVLSGYVDDASGEQNCIQSFKGIYSQRPELDLPIEEADGRIIPHLAKAVEDGHQRAVVLANDADVFILLIHYMNEFMSRGLKELWIKYGTGKSERFIPIHILFTKLDSSISSSLLKMNVLTGSDVTSKVGTKSSALKVIQDIHLWKFGDKESQDEGFKDAEHYVVKDMQTKSGCSTFNELR